jgi:hypothetical protein
MARLALTCAFLMLCAIFILSPVNAFSPAQLDSSVRASSAIVHVSKKCDQAFGRCVKKCKKDQSCVSVCALDQDWCNAFCPTGKQMC